MKLSKLKKKKKVALLQNQEIHATVFPLALKEDAKKIQRVVAFGVSPYSSLTYEFPHTFEKLYPREHIPFSALAHGAQKGSAWCILCSHNLLPG